MKKTFSMVVWIMLALWGVAGADSLWWTWETTTWCVLLSQVSTGDIIIDWGDSTAEELPVTSGSHVSPFCHDYGTTGTYTVSLSATGAYYLDLTGQNLTSFSGGIASELQYLGLAANPQLALDTTDTATLVTNISALTGLEYLVLSDTISSISGYNNLLAQLSGVAADFSTGMSLYVRSTQYGGCDEPIADLGKNGREYLTTTKIWDITDGGLSSCAPAPTPTAPSYSWGGGWGSSLKKDSCPNGDFSDSYYDNSCDKDSRSETQDSSKEDSSKEDSSDASEGTLSIGAEEVDKEILTAYDRAFKHNITTLAPLTGANPDWTVIRGHLAKMIVNYATNILGRTIPENVPADCYRKDGRNAWESDEIKDFAKKSCQLGLMGIDMEYFQPNAVVTRAQFGTILSRLLRQNTYAGGSPYYTKHLKALKENGILTQIDNPEQRQELRQWVWLMLMRSVK